MDASAAEELGGDERIHITLGDDGHLHSLQKGLRSILAAEFAEILEVSQNQCDVLRKMVESAGGN